MAKKKTVKAEVKAAYLGTKDFEAKMGDVIEIPEDEKKRSPATKHATKSVNLVVIDLAPTKSEEVKE